VRLRRVAAAAAAQGDELRRRAGGASACSAAGRLACLLAGWLAFPAPSSASAQSRRALPAGGAGANMLTGSGGSISRRSGLACEEDWTRSWQDARGRGEEKSARQFAVHCCVCSASRGRQLFSLSSGTDLCERWLVARLQVGWRNWERERVENWNCRPGLLFGLCEPPWPRQLQVPLARSHCIQCERPPRGGKTEKEHCCQSCVCPASDALAG